MDNSVKPVKPKGRPKNPNKLTVLQRVRRHRLKQERIADAQMKELAEIFRSIKVTKEDDNV